MDCLDSASAVESRDVETGGSLLVLGHCWYAASCVWRGRPAVLFNLVAVAVSSMTFPYKSSSISVLLVTLCRLLEMCCVVIPSR